MAVLPIGMSGEAGGYQIERSLRFNSADSTYLSRTPASAGNRRTWTWSGWVKRSALSSSQVIFSSEQDSINFTGLYFFADNTFVFYTVTGGTDYSQDTVAVLRDTSAWYHLVVAIDTTQANASDRLKFYVNGTLQTVTQSYGQIPQNYDAWINTLNQHALGRNEDGGIGYFNGYLTDINFIDGSALTPSSFGETDSDTGVWKPKAYTGSYGTNGFYLKFADNSGTTSTTLGKDSSPNGNNWTPNNFSVTAGAGNDSLVDTPTPYGTDTGAGGEVRGNYAVLNTLSIVANASLSNGNLDATNTSGSNYRTFVSTIAIPSGSWYCEFTAGANTSGDNMFVGICPASAALSSTYIGSSATSYAYSSNGTKYNNASATSYGASFTNGDVIGVSFNGSTLTFYKNGVSQGSAFTSLSGDFVFALSLWGTAVCTANFGQRPFAYTAPSGFKALCTTNLPTPAIGATASTRADDYFNTVLWTGNDASPRTISGVGFQPDLVWIKPKSLAQSHHIFDAVRGTQVELRSNTTDAELTSTYGNLTAYASDGFTLTAGVNGIANVNANNETFVAWNWKANGSGVTNTAGTITSTVSANTTSGFSIVTYTGTGANATVGHGLGAVPKMFILKERNGSSAADFWATYHVSLGNTKYLTLNTTGAEATAAYWNNTTPSSSVITLGSNTNINDTGATYVIYAFAPVAGFSAFGSYTGNGSTNGPFIYTGFRPAFVMIKLSSASGDGWLMRDTKRSTYNVQNAELYANLSDAENTGSSGEWDFLSNGFKLRSTLGSRNASGATYIYMAFAENPFKYSLAR